MKNIITLLVLLSALTLTACSKGNGTRTDKPKDKGRGEALTGSDEIFKKVADAIVQQNIEEIRKLYSEYNAGDKRIKYNASCFNKKFADSIYYNLTLPQIAAIYAVNSNNTSDESIFKIILENTEKILPPNTDKKQKTFIHYSCDNTRYPIHILAAYGHYNAMTALLKFRADHMDEIINASLLIEQIPDPTAFPGLLEYSKHNFKFTEAASKYYKVHDINLQGDYVRRTPLYTAMYYERYDIVNLLIQNSYIGCYDWEVIRDIEIIDRNHADTITEKCKSN